MKHLLILLIIISGAFISSCHKTTIGYLITENASYDPDTMYIRKTPDPELDAIRIQNKAPWVSLQLQGYEGTELMYFYIESVRYEEKTPTQTGIEAAQNFTKDLSIRNGGVMLYPFENNALPGTYKVSIRITNPGYSHVLLDAMTIIVTE